MIATSSYGIYNLVWIRLGFDLRQMPGSQNRKWKHVLSPIWVRCLSQIGLDCLSEIELVWSQIGFDLHWKQTWMRNRLYSLDAWFGHICSCISPLLLEVHRSHQVWVHAPVNRHRDWIEIGDSACTAARVTGPVQYAIPNPTRTTSLLPKS